MQLFAKELAQFGNYTGLQNYYFTKLYNILSLKQPKKSFIGSKLYFYPPNIISKWKNILIHFLVWEDVFQSLNGFLPKDVTVHVWKNWNNLSWQERIKEVKNMVVFKILFINHNYDTF